MRNNIRLYNTKTITVTVARSHKSYYYLTDHLGSVRVTVNDAGDPVGWDDYYPFGLQMPERTQNASNPNDDTKFTGYLFEQDGDLEIYHAEARMYDPVLGRFMSVDPMADEYPSWSPYNYVKNNPLGYTDPTGLYPACGNNCDETYQSGNIVENRHGSWEYLGDNQWLDLNSGDTISGSDLLTQYESQFANTSVAALGVFVPIAAAEPTPVGEFLLGSAAVGIMGHNLWQSLNAPSGIIELGTPTISFSAQDKKLTDGDIRRLEDAGIDIHKEKGGRATGKIDLYKKPNGDIVIKPKGGKGPGEPTGLNIKDF